MSIIGFENRNEIKAEKKEEMIRPKLEAAKEWISDNTESIVGGIYAGIIIISFGWMITALRNMKLQNKLLEKIIKG